MSGNIENFCVIGNELAVVFDDGREIFLSLALLRRACPCASCQGEPDAMGRVVKPKQEWGRGAFDVRNYERVGGYAIRMDWADGHCSGIYSISYLEKLDELARDAGARGSEG